MVDTVRTQAQLLSFLHPNIGNAMPDATVLQAQTARDLIVSIFPFFPNGAIPGGGVDPFNTPVSVSASSPALVTQVAHGQATGNIVEFAATGVSGSLPGGISPSTPYYVSVVSADTFRVSSSAANLAASVFVNTTSTGSSVRIDVPAQLVNINNWNGVTPVSTLGPTMKVTREELYTTAAANPVSPINNATLFLASVSDPGNKNQPVALGIGATGYSEGGLFNLGYDLQVQQNSGANVGGNYGGAMGGYANVHGYFDHGGIFGYGTDVYNATKLDGASASGAQAGYDISVGGDGSYNASITMTSASPTVVTWTAHGLVSGNAIEVGFDVGGGVLPIGIGAGSVYYITVVDANTFKLSTSQANRLAGTFVNTSSTGSNLRGYFFARFGSGIQLRVNAGPGGDVGLNFLSGNWNTGIDFSGASFNTQFIKFQPGFIIFNAAGDPTAPSIGFDANDYLTYHTADNTYHAVINNADTHFWGTGAFGFVGLRTTAPGAGSKQFWYDPADGNRVKYVA